ncbi:MAG: hypothetical protein KDM81_00405 [Verrucomicrobiae bacterium]|nr:hypothetical protein [Verrucomicrobiae bacterium]
MAFLANPGFAQDVAPAAEDIRDVKALIEIPPPPDYGLWIAITLGTVMVGFLLWKFLSRSGKPVSLSAADRALAEIDSARSLIGEESPEPLANAVTGAIRRYLDARFGIAAPRQTTEEFLRTLQARRHPELAPYGEDLGRFLRFCDAVKFGRGELAAETRMQLIESARNFVATSRQPVAESAEKGSPKSVSPVPA